MVIIPQVPNRLPQLVTFREAICGAETLDTPSELFARPKVHLEAGLDAQEINLNLFTFTSKKQSSSQGYDNLVRV